MPISAYNQAVNQLDPNMTQQQREMQLQRLQAQFNQDLSGTVNSTFTDPQTLSRYNQLNVSFMVSTRSMTQTFAGS